LKPVVVVGAGPSGLLQALFLAKRGHRVIVIEQQPVLGGMFAGAATPWGVVDQGIHIIQETGDPAWDALFTEILPAAEWSVFTGPKRDLAGNVFAGSFDDGSMFPDLRRLPRAAYQHCVDEMRDLTGTPPVIAETANLADYLERRFGRHAVERVFEPVARKIWRQSAARIHPAAARIVYLARVVIDDHAATLALKRSPAWDERLAFPDQRNVPAAFAAGRPATRYPAGYGIWRVVEGLRAALERHGATLLPATRLRGIERGPKRIDALQLASGERGEARVEVDAVVWTLAPAELLRLHDMPVAALPDPPVPHRFVWLLCDRPPLSGDVHWLRSFEPGDPVVRMSNPAAYCPDSAADGHPLCVEMHVDDPNTPDDRAAELAESALRALGLVAAETRVRAAQVLPGSRNFFVPTLANCAALAADARALDGVRPDNLVISAQDIGAAIFYLPEILTAATEKLLAL
jgi:protoporphyrinogen oxidase